VLVLDDDGGVFTVL